MAESPLDLLDTPVALVDLDRMEANLRRIAAYCEAHGLAWRPHAKTHKTPALAAAQLRAGACGVTVATLREAEVMSAAVGSLLLAYPPLGEPKRRRLCDLLAAGVEVTVGLDSPEALEVVASAAMEAGAVAGVLVELDVGMRRVGVATPEAAVSLARQAAHLASVEYRGVMFYPGHILAVAGDDDAAIAEASGVLAGFLDALAAAGLPPRVVSGGSTPTLWHSHRFRGLTEIRPGTNIFNDRTTAAVGACGWDECAYSVLATVVSTAVPGQAVIDAGAKALAKEELRGAGEGYGALLDRPEVPLRALSEEHGILDLANTEWVPRVGERVRVVPNHVCVSVNLHERLYGVRGGVMVAEWEVEGRGRAPFPLSASGARSGSEAAYVTAPGPVPTL
jgi:D-serine deaminase-like pyridoxal phosphate-dependent protein